MIERLRPMSRNEVRQLDIEAAQTVAMPTSLLMENAGRGAAIWFAELVGAVSPHAGRHPYSLPQSVESRQVPHGPRLPRVLIMCGPGNNGGDGGVVARHLDAWGFPVRVIWFARSNQLRGDAGLQWSILDKSGIHQTTWLDEYPSDFASSSSVLTAVITEADWLVDGLLGTGLSRPVEGLLRSVIQLINDSGKPVLALDLPSGLDADTGQPLGIAVHATATATFVAPKLGFSTVGTTDFTGEVAVIDIGLPGCLLKRFRNV